MNYDIKSYGRQAKKTLDEYISMYLGSYENSVYINEIKLDWCRITKSQEGSLKEYPLDPSDVPDQIQTNLRIGNKKFEIEAKFKFNNSQKKELFEQLEDLFLKKEQIKIMTQNDIFENLLITSISSDLDLHNYSFRMTVIQFQTAKIMTTGDAKSSEATQINDTTTVGTQGVTSSNVTGGCLT